MTITQTQQEGRIIFAVSGRIDAAAATRFQEALLPVLSFVPVVELNFANLLYISSAGLRVLLLAVKAAKQTGTQIILRNLSGDIHKVIQTIGLDAVLTIE
ncbi:MAG: STAS domain-containing protein [Planctomycetaceae bacterium]|jgi:anti-anti-sigma factor|nr:STAS domain-containing protein [Planctomycetaceae bacterium]